MKKRILPFLCLLLLGTLLLQPVCAQAVTPLDPNASASLTLRYEKEGTPFADLSIGIYRVAEAFSDGTFQLITPYVAYPVIIHGITDQAQWKHAAVTLSAYIVADGIAPDKEMATDADGMVCFEDLQTGLYLVREVLAENDNGVYLFDQFFIYLPTPQEDGSYQYHMEAKPKCVDFVPKNQYTVTKLWQDDGHQQGRPSEVTIDIYCDGELQETKALNAANNWSYTWQVTGKEQGVWTVAERTVSQPYTVTIQQNGNNFSVINTRKSQPATPETGDSFNPLPLVLAMCISGLGMLILGIYIRRKA